MRQRDERFIALLLDELAKNPDGDAAALSAGMRMMWRTRAGTPMKPAQVAKKVERKLQQEDILAGLREHFGQSADFWPQDGASWLVKHIKGEVSYEETAVSKDGEVVRYEKTLPPSLSALNAYHALTLPKPATKKQVQVDQRVLVAKALVSDEPPQMRVRTLEHKAIAGDGPSD